MVRKYRPITVSTTLLFVFGAPERKDEDNGMGKTRKAPKAYLLVKRYVVQNRGTWNSSFVPADTYQTFVAAKAATFGLLVTAIQE